MENALKTAKTGFEECESDFMPRKKNQERETFLLVNVTSNGGLVLVLVRNQNQTTSHRHRLRHRYCFRSFLMVGFAYRKPSVFRVVFVLALFMGLSGVLVWLWVFARSAAIASGCTFLAETKRVFVHPVIFQAPVFIGLQKPDA